MGQTRLKFELMITEMNNQSFVYNHFTNDVPIQCINVSLDQFRVLFFTFGSHPKADKGMACVLGKPTHLPIRMMECGRFLQKTQITSQPTG